MKTYAIVANTAATAETAAGPVTLAQSQVLTVVVWDGSTPYDVGDGFDLVEVPAGWGVSAEGQLVKLPEPPTPEPVVPVLQTYKSDIWRRASDEEAEIIDAALNAAPVKQRRLWADSTILVHGADGWDAIRDQMVAAFGVERADEILAPSL
jgi:hypothetical protein